MSFFNPPARAHPSSLANSGKSVLHLDPNEHYGAAQASLTLDELGAWADALGKGEGASEGSYAVNQRRRYTDAWHTPLDPGLTAARRAYALSLYPALLPSRGTLIQTLIDSGVSKYVGFRLLDGVAVWDGAEAQRVPGSKEDVFKDKTVSLVDKRRLMRFLLFVAGDYDSDDVLKGEGAVRLVRVSVS